MNESPMQLALIQALFAPPIMLLLFVVVKAFSDYKWPDLQTIPKATRDLILVLMIASYITAVGVIVIINSPV